MYPFAHSSSLFHIQAHCSRKHSRTFSIKTVVPIQNTDISHLQLNMQLFSTIHAPKPRKRLLTNPDLLPRNSLKHQKKKKDNTSDVVIRWKPTMGRDINRYNATGNKQLAYHWDKCWSAQLTEQKSIKICLPFFLHITNVTEIYA
jgi:hypothetical protein